MEPFEWKINWKNLIKHYEKEKKGNKST